MEPTVKLRSLCHRPPGFLIKWSSLAFRLFWIIILTSSDFYAESNKRASLPVTKCLLSNKHLLIRVFSWTSFIPPQIPAAPAIMPSSPCWRKEEKVICMPIARASNTGLQTWLFGLQRQRHCLPYRLNTWVCLSLERVPKSRNGAHRGYLVSVAMGLCFRVVVQSWLTTGEFI